MYLIAKYKIPSLISHLLFKQPKRAFKIASYLPIISRKSVLNKSNYKLVYDFPLIKFPVAFARSRYSVALGSVCLVPCLILFTSKFYAITCLLSAAAHYFVSAASSKFSENMVGKIYINKEGDFQELIISSMDKFGRRIDRVHKLEEIINCDYYSKYSKHLGFITLIVENSDIHYKVNIRACKIHNTEICSFLLGSACSRKTT